MKKPLILILILMSVLNFVFAQQNRTSIHNPNSVNTKYAKWQNPSYFRGYNVLYESPHTLQDFIDLKNYGGNLFHIQPDGFFGTDAPYGLVQLNIDGTDLLVNFCRQAGVHYVIGMRSGPGAYDTFDESQGTTGESRVWNTGNTVEQQKYAEMLQMVVQRYANDTLFVGINMVIEPRPKVTGIPANTSENYKFFLENIYNIHMDQVYQSWVAKIREVDPELPVIAESFAYSTPELYPGYVINDPYMVYSAHNYQPVEYSKAETPMSVTYPGTYWNLTYLSPQLFNGQFMRETVFSKVIEFQETTGAPVFLGEFGMFKPQIGGDQYINDVLSICMENGWHFALWDWRRGGGQNWNIEGFTDPGNLHWKTVLSKLYAPPVPEPVSPIDCQGGSVNPTFQWNNLTAFTTYDLMIVIPNNPVSIIIEDISGTSYTYTGTLLQEAKRYKWLLRAKNPGGEEHNKSDWSESQCFSTSASDLSSRTSPEDNKFTLKQNSPNPFNPSTNISYSIPKSGMVKLVVYDLLGREISSLVSQLQAEGSYSVLFNASNLPSGVYIYRLEAHPSDGTAGFTEIKRMILVK